jgi:hypothetical protein
VAANVPPRFTSDNFTNENSGYTENFGNRAWVVRWFSTVMAEGIRDVFGAGHQLQISESVFIASAVDVVGLQTFWNFTEERFPGDLMSRNVFPDPILAKVKDSVAFLEASFARFPTGFWVPTVSRGPHDKTFIGHCVAFLIANNGTPFDAHKPLSKSVETPIFSLIWKVPSPSF